MKKLMLAVAVVTMAGSAFAYPGFVGGGIGNLIAKSVFDSDSPVLMPPAQAQVQAAQREECKQTVVSPKKVWVDGRYVDQVQPDGSKVRVWQTGHFESAPACAGCGCGKAAKKVWVDGRYVDKVQPDGSKVRVWETGHFEPR